MREKMYQVKTRGTSKQKLYKYQIRHIFGVNLEDLITLLGPEPAARLLHFYGSTSMYIPSVKTIRRQLKEAMIKEECRKLLEMGKTRTEVIEELSRKDLGYSKNTLKMKLVRWFGESEDKRIYKFRDTLTENLLDKVAQNYQLFKSYRIL